MKGGRRRDRGMERGYEGRERGVERGYEGRERDRGREKEDMRGGREMNIQYSYTIA